MAISLKQFGPLYHGSAFQGVEQIHHADAPMSFSSAMPGGHSWANFSTTSVHEAKEYARSNADVATRQTGKKHYPEVYEVAPTNWRTEEWEPDEHSGPNGYYDGPQSRREAFEMASEGSPVSIRHTVPLKTKRTVWAEQKAQDITPYDRSFT
jgi:hypothetical protein